LANLVRTAFSASSIANDAPRQKQQFRHAELLSDNDFLEYLSLLT
jgi:hypothetical protein